MKHHRVAFPAADFLGVAVSQQRLVVTRLAEAGCTEAEIASITGHSVKSVGAILDRYLARTKGLALSAIAKLEKNKK